MSLALLFHYSLLKMFRMLVHSSSGACDLLWIYLMGCIALVRCVLVLRCGSAGVVWYPYAGWSTTENKHLIVASCWFSLSSHFAHDVRSQEPKDYNITYRVAEKYGSKLQTGLTYLRVSSNGELLCEHGEEHSGSVIAEYFPNISVTISLSRRSFLLRA
jgi:hypothetical protein